MEWMILVGALNLILTWALYVVNYNKITAKELQISFLSSAVNDLSGVQDQIINDMRHRKNQDGAMVELLTELPTCMSDKEKIQYISQVFMYWRASDNAEREKARVILHETLKKN